jgi:hypothetical protein
LGVLLTVTLATIGTVTITMNDANSRTEQEKTFAIVLAILAPHQKLESVQPPSEASRR